MTQRIGAIILAAGLSARMGQPKMLLPWGNKTIIEHVVESCGNAAQEILVVTGKLFPEISDRFKTSDVKVIFNPQYANEEMLDSLRAGLALLGPEVEAVFIVLGDQPFLKPEILRKEIEIFNRTGGKIIIPSFQMRRGHPWLVHRDLFTDFFALEPGQTMRDFLQKHKDQIAYCEVNDGTILLDLDTPEDYEKYKPGNT